MPVVIVLGEFERGDGERFANQVASLERAVVALDSPGGNVVAGLRMGQLIHNRGFSTIVPDRTICASACGLVWLAGASRLMEAGARIGFHAAYTVRAGRARESGAANALIGAYLSRLGLSDQTILYVSQAAPENMTWLTPAAAGRLGLELRVVPPGTQGPQTEEPGRGLPSQREASRPGRDGGAKLPVGPVPGATPDAPSRDQTEQATAFASRFFSTWSDTNDRAIAAFRTFYADNVNFYGSPATRQALLDRKQAFAVRWPERIYAVRNDTLTANCVASRCVVAGTVDWDARAGTGDARTVGVARFELTLDTRGSPVIVAETGAVISRGDGAPPASPATPAASP